MSGGTAVEFCARHVPRFNPISVSGTHIAECGAKKVSWVVVITAGFGEGDAGGQRFQPQRARR